MTTPTGLEFLAPKTKDTSSVPSGLEFLHTTPEEQNQSFADYAGNLIKHYFSTGSFLTLLDPGMREQAMAGQAPGILQGIKDLGHMFDQVISYTPDVAGAAHLGKDLSGFKLPKASEVVGGLPIGILKPIGDMMELSSGLNLTVDEPRPLTPEETAARVKGSVALAATAFVPEIVAGQLGKSILAKAATGAAAGGSYGFIAGANDPEQLKQTISNSILGAGFGTAFGLFDKNPGEPLKTKPQDVAQVRALIDDNNTFGEVLKTSGLLGNSDNLAEALLNGKIGLSKGDVHIIPGISPEKLASLSSDLPEGYRSAIHVDKDGIGKLLAYDETVPNVDERFFEKYGVLKDQTVSYLGKEDWQVKGVSPKGLLNLENKIDGNKIEAHPNDIQSPSNISFENASQAIIDNYYREWKALVDKPQTLETNPNAQAYDPIGFDDTPPSDILDKVPEHDGVQLLKHLNDFIASKNLSPDLAKQLKWELQLKLANEAMGRLDIEDKQLIEEGRRVYQEDTRTAKQKIKDHNSLVSYAKLHGFNISDGSSGRYIIHDLQTGKILAGADNIDKAREWISKGGKTSGPKLDDNEHIDTNIAAGGGSLPPEGPPKAPEDYAYDFANSPSQAAKGNIGENFIRFLDQFPLITRYRNYFAEIDRVHNTQFLAAYDRVMEARNKRNFQSKPYAEELGKIKSRYNLTPGEEEMIMKYMETMSPEEVINKLMSRPMNPTEIGFARQLAGLQTNLPNVFKFRRQLDALNGEYPPEVRQDAAKELEYQQHTQALKDALQIDDKHIQAAKLMDDVETLRLDQASLGAVVRLARALNDGVGRREMSKAEFARFHKLNPKIILAANDLSALYKKLAKVFNIPEDQQLGSYVTHAKLYYDGDIKAAFKQFSGPTAAKDFFSSLTRTGEINAFETNPFKATLRYIKSGFDVNSEFNTNINDARKAIKTEALKIADDGTSKTFANVATRALNETQGIPAAIDQAAKETVERVFSSRYKIVDEAVKSSWASALGSIVNAGALGFRPFLGLIHFGTSLGISEFDRGFNYTRKMLVNAAKAWANKDQIAELQAKGVFTGMAPFSIMNPEIDPTTRLGRVTQAIDKASDIAFKATLLPTVYDKMVAGHYVTTYNDAIDALTKLSRKEITAAQADKAMFIKHYDVAVARQFKLLATQNIKDAAHYLGRQAVEDLVGTYGNGNTPYMWGSKFGRLFGQYGNFPMWIRGTMQRMMSRGTVADRAMVAAKIVAWHYAMKGISQQTGIDFQKMDPLHPLAWAGGPSATIIMDALNAVHSKGYEQTSALRRLSRLLPVDASGNLHPSIFLPGSYAVDGIIQAADDVNQGNDFQAAMQALGFRKYQAAKALGRGIP